MKRIIMLEIKEDKRNNMSRKRSGFSGRKGQGAERYFEVTRGIIGNVGCGWEVIRAVEIR